MMSAGAVRRFAERVVARLGVDADVAVAVSDVRPDGRGELLIMLETVNGAAGYAGYQEHGRARSVESAARCASQVQDAMLEAAWGAPTPRCPGHAHPMTPDHDDDAWWWRCPTDGLRVERGTVLGA